MRRLIVPVLLIVGLIALLPAVFAAPVTINTTFSFLNPTPAAFGCGGDGPYPYDEHTFDVVDAGDYSFTLSNISTTSGFGVVLVYPLGQFDPNCGATNLIGSSTGVATLTLSAGSYTMIGYGETADSTGSFDLEITGLPPTSSFTSSATDLTVNFTDTSSHGPSSWAWDFGDGNNSSAQNPQHIYAAAGSYNVCLTASNAIDTGNQFCQNVTVTAAVSVPTSDFTFSVNNLMVNFSDTSTQNPTSWAWTFGDGNNSSAQNPQHVYAAGGTYNVCLTATNSIGPGNQACQDVTVTAAQQTGTFTFLNPTPAAFGCGGDGPYPYDEHTFDAASNGDYTFTLSNISTTSGQAVVLIYPLGQFDPNCGATNLIRYFRLAWLRSPCRRAATP